MVLGFYTNQWFCVPPPFYLYVPLCLAFSDNNKRGHSSRTATRFDGQWKRPVFPGFLVMSGLIPTCFFDSSRHHKMRPTSVLFLVAAFLLPIASSAKGKIPLYKFPIKLFSCFMLIYLGVASDRLKDTMNKYQTVQVAVPETALPTARGLLLQVLLLFLPEKTFD